MVKKNTWSILDMDVNKISETLISKYLSWNDIIILAFKGKKWQVIPVNINTLYNNITIVQMFPGN